MRIPFDSLTLAAVVAELQPYVGGKVQRVVQSEPLALSFGLYANGHAATFFISADPIFARAHFITRFPPSSETQYGLCTAMRAKIDGARLLEVSQVGFDRILRMRFGRSDSEHVLISELMGKHANIILTEGDGRIVSAAKWIPPAKSKRPIQAGAKYKPPPFAPKKSLLEAPEGADFKEFEGASAFLLKLMEAGGATPAMLKELVNRGFEGQGAIISPGAGAYPLSVASLGLQEFSRPSISVALEQHFVLAVPAHQAEALRASILGSLRRVELARETAIADLQESLVSSGRAGEQQLRGELILAYAGTIPIGASLYETEDYEGKPLVIKLDPTLSALENANAYFEKAKRGKARVGGVSDQLVRLNSDLGQLRDTILRVETAPDLEKLGDLKEFAETKRWLNRQVAIAKKEDRPFEGHRIRELLGPGGVTVLYGENAEANDYLTLRVAKPNDLWLHVRGSTSSHVVIQTGNHPEKIGREALMFAAKVAVMHSTSKHSKYVPVDYTLKKYVRKPRGAAKGAAFYTNEKTLHVE